MVGGGLSGSAGSSAAPRQKLAGHAYVKAPLPLQLPLLSLGTLGAQAVWSIDMAFAPPYLLELGLSKSGMAAVFVAGPLSGLVVQPLIGALADNSTSKHGRRRPLLAIGALICCASVLMLSFARELAAIFTRWDSSSHRFLAIAVAVVSIYFIDFSVNAITALNRALMIDVASIEDQAAANAWAARLSGAGSVLSFLIGNLDLPALLPAAFGKTQIQILSVITCLFVISTHAVVLYLVKEQVLVRSYASGQTKGLGLGALFRDLSSQARNLPAPILEIFKIQFFAWIGWFPILFYTTVWVGDIYKSNQLPAPVGPDGGGGGGTGGNEAMFEEATRVGSRAMFWHAVVAFISSIVLPLVVPSPLGESSRAAMPRFLRGIERLRSRCPGLTFWWVFSHFIFCIAMMGTFIASLAESVFFATLLIAAVGFCWCVTNWVPFGLLGILIQNHSVDAHEMTQRLDDARPARSSLEARRSANGGNDDHDDDDDDEEGSEDVEAMLVAHPELSGDGGDEVQGTSGHSGSILGLHNLAIVLPQFAVTIVSSIIFAIVDTPSDPNSSTPLTKASSNSTTIGGRAAHPSTASNGDAVGIVLRLGGVSALVAGVLGVRFARRYGHLLSE